MLEQAMRNFALLGAGWVLWLLVILSLLCVGIGVERTIVLFTGRSPRVPFEGAVATFLGGGPREAFERAVADMPGVEAKVVRAGLQARIPQAAEGAMVGTLLFEKLRMERGLIIVGTVASTAAFIGLFGTVLGIIQAFHDLSLENDDAGKAVMAGISEALVATAAALMVAIPAVVLYNLLTRWIKARVSRMESLAGLIVSRLRAEEA